MSFPAKPSIREHAHTDSCARMYTCTSAHTAIHPHAHSQARVHTCAHLPTQADLCAYRRTHVCVHTQTHRVSARLWPLSLHLRGTDGEDLNSQCHGWQLLGGGETRSRFSFLASVGKSAFLLVLSGYEHRLPSQTCPGVNLHSASQLGILNQVPLPL